MRPLPATAFPRPTRKTKAPFWARSPSAPGGVTKANARGIFADLTGFGYAAIARLGDATGIDASIFSSFDDPVLNTDGDLAFLATIKGKTIKGLAATTLWWQPPGESLELLAQGGGAPAGLPGAQYKAFTSLANADNRGPIFAATLLPGKGGISRSGASGVWAVDFQGTLHLLFQTGVPDAIVSGKTLKSFTLLNAAVGSTGVTHSFNDGQQLVWLATFTDKSQAIMTTEIP